MVFNKNYEFKVGWCHICKQGWIEIVKDIKTQTLFFCCDECETCWDNYEDILIPNKSFRNKYERIEDPTLEEVTAIGWDKYILKN